MPRNIFFVGLNDFNRRKLESLPNASDYRFHGLLDPSEILDADSFPVADMLERAEKQLAAFDGTIDAIVGYMDFPVSTMLPILCGRFGTRSASLEAMLKCEHKYWSRVEQRAVVPEHIPPFCRIDPFHPDPLSQLELEYPFWLKPVKSAGSNLGFRIGNQTDFLRAIDILRQEIGRYSDPFNYILEHIELPPEVADVDGRYCIAEGLIGGRQCTLEGYAHDGRVHIHGTVDSIRYPNRSSFFRYQYPSRIPLAVRRRMADIVRRVLRHIGFDSSAFNVEFFWDEHNDRIWLLEINTRIAQHHSDLFQKVDGASNHEVAVEVALGHKPKLPRREGPFRCAAVCFYRRFRDAIVAGVPSPAEIAEVEARYRGTIVELDVGEGTRLSQLPDQDSYSYIVAHMYVGADDTKELLNKYRECRDALGFRFKRVGKAARGEAA